MGNIANVTNFTVYKEGDGISFQTLYETASQGPCPSGYHIPTKNEMQYVFNTLKTLEGGTVTAQNLQDHLFIPPVGYIDRQTGQQSTSYGVVRVWTCTFSGAQCYTFKDDTGGVGLSLDRPATGMQIRPFANQPIAPDSSWTTPLSIGTASLSVNHTLGLISITADGEKYITLSDKNLGATAYYNGTVSAANTGHYYQAGNNYGFDTPITNTSDTKVDTTGYGPGNYYNSDTYICGSNISDWRTKSNDNLWGGVGIAKGVSINAEVSMNDLTDTNITAPTNGDVLSYNATSEKWENKEVEADSSNVSYRGMSVEQALDEEYKPVENLITDNTKVIDGFWFKEEGVCKINSTSIPEFQSFYIPVEEGKTYYTAAKMSGLWIGYLDENEQAVDSLTVSGSAITIPTGQGIKYLSYPQRQAYKPTTIISEKPAEFVGELDIYRMTSAGENKLQFPSQRSNGNYYATDTAFTEGTTYWYADYTYNLKDSVIGIGMGSHILGVNTQDNTAISLSLNSSRIYLFNITDNTYVYGDSPVTIPEEWVTDVPHHKTPSGLHGMVRVDDENNYILRAEGLSDFIIPKSAVKTRVESQSKVFENYTTASGMIWNYGAGAYKNAGVFTARHRGPIVEKKSTEVDNHWFGKSWYAYGTSMTDASMNGYTVELQSLLGANLTNYGKGGSGIIPSLHGGTSGDNTYTRVKRTTDGKTNADLITLEIIPNDMSGTLGTPTDNYADGQTETFCGCLNELLQYLQVNTNAQIVVLIATRSRYNYQDPTEKYPPESQKATDWIQWTDAAKECCRRNCVPFIDGQSNCGLGYARVSGDNKYVRDQIHLTTLGAKNLGQYFYSQIKNIPPFYSA